MKKLSISFLFFTLFLNVFTQTVQLPTIVNWGDIKAGDARTTLYFSKLKYKKIALVANHTSMIGQTHLADSLLNAGFDLLKVFVPEHGFRGESDAGTLIVNAKDAKTGLPIISLYGDHKKPTKKDIENIDLVLFDLQDVGVRFYTYLSTMCYVMEACAENDIPLIILDRPNPNGFYVDGPILQSKYKSFVGLHHIPIVHGLTLGEYALMVNGEGWLINRIKCNIEIIKVENYAHGLIVNLPIKPSPNLPNLSSILLYPSLALFEGTSVSIGRGTSNPFECIGHPKYHKQNFSFTPVSTPGASLNPPHENKNCFGHNLNDYYLLHPDKLGKIELKWLLDFHQDISVETSFFNNYFEKLAGTSLLREQIENAVTIKKIRKSWQKGLNKYKKTRAKYLLYPDFE